MDTAPISVGFGKITFDDASASLSAFEVKPPFLRKFPAKAFPVIGRVQAFNATAYPEVSGTLMLNTLSAPDGAILCLQYSQRVRRISTYDAAVWLSIRKTGPAITAAVNLPAHRDSLLGPSFLMFQGRADVLTMGEVRAAGINPTNAWVDGFMQEDEIEKCFVVTELALELGARPVFETIVSMSGEEVTIKAPDATRRIRMKGRSTAS